MDDGDFLSRFENCTLPFAQWTHRSHVKLAYLYVGTHPFEQAVGKTRTGIKAFNATNKIPETTNTGYNETTTVAFLTIIASTLSFYGGLFPSGTSDEFCDRHPHLLQKSLLRLFYSPDRRGHPEAKYRFIEPDLAQLPLIRDHPSK